jgi:YajG family uncharacterized lipoprotein
VGKFWKIGMLGLGLFCLSRSALSQEKVSLTLEVPPQFFMSLCPEHPFQGEKVFLKSVEDNRSSPILGMVTKKGGKNPVEVDADPPLQVVFKNYLSSVLEACGMQLVQAPEGSEYQIQFTIEEFHGEEEKHLVTGKGQATSRLSFMANSPTRKVTGNVSYGVDFKQGRKRGIERLREILNELLQETLRQIPGSPQLRTLKS